MIDSNDIRKFSKIIYDCNRELKGLVPAIALAKTVIEMASDRRKKLLADCMEGLKSELKGEARQFAARATPEYAEGLETHKAELQSAYEVDFQWRSTNSRLDSARSLLAVSRETLRNFQE